MAFWMIRGGRDDEFYAPAREYGYAILGFFPLGSLENCDQQSDLRNRLRSAYPSDKGSGLITRWSNEIWNFRHVMQPGDDVIMPYKNGARFLMGRCIDGPYRYIDWLADRGRHTRPVAWSHDLARDELPAGLWDQLQGQVTVRLLAGPAPGAIEPGRSPVDPESEHREGQRFIRESTFLARNKAAVSRKWKSSLVDGVAKCECCRFPSRDRGMFDVHHLLPLSIKERDTKPTDLALLCPRCHRQAHRKPGLLPYSLDEIRAIVSGSL